MDLSSLQKYSQERSQIIDFPHTKQERFSYVPVQHFKVLKPSTISEEPHSNRLCSQEEYKDIIQDKKYYILLDNGIYQDQSRLPNGVKITSSFEEQLDWKISIENAFKNEADWGALQVLSNTPSLSIFITKEITDPIHLIYTHSKKNITPQNFFISLFLEEKSTAHFSVELFGHEAPINIVSNIFLKKFSKCHFSSNHQFPLSHSWFHKLNVWQKKHSTFKGHSISKGSPKVARESIDVFLMDSKTHFDWYGLSKLESKNQFHRHIEVHHLASNTYSNQLFRNVLTDQSKSSVNSTISIVKKVNQINGNQLINNLMLSDQCQSNNKPNLQIYADDVKCSHGVTIGRLNENQLVYLQTRGYNKELAKQTLTHVFLLEFIKKIEHPQIRNTVLKNF